MAWRSTRSPRSSVPSSERPSASAGCPRRRPAVSSRRSCLRGPTHAAALTRAKPNTWCIRSSKKKPIPVAGIPPAPRARQGDDVGSTREFFRRFSCTSQRRRQCPQRRSRRPTSRAWQGNAEEYGDPGHKQLSVERRSDSPPRPPPSPDRRRSGRSALLLPPARARELADHRQALAGGYRGRGERVTQVVDAGILQPGAGAEPLPAGL